MPRPQIVSQGATFFFRPMPTRQRTHAGVAQTAFDLSSRRPRRLQMQTKVAVDESLFREIENIRTAGWRRGRYLTTPISVDAQETATLRDVRAGISNRVRTRILYTMFRQAARFDGQNIASVQKVVGDVIGTYNHSAQRGDSASILRRPSSD